MTKINDDDLNNVSGGIRKTVIVSKNDLTDISIESDQNSDSNIFGDFTPNYSGDLGLVKSILNKPKKTH